jgi:hypothetical protein
MRYRSSLVCVLVLLILSTSVVSGAEFSDQAVEAAIAKGVRFLWSKQRKDGSWEAFKNDAKRHSVGYTAMAAYALLESGVRVSDPRMQRTLNWLKARPNCQEVYDLGVVCNVWLLADRQAPGQYMKHLLRDGNRLATGLYKGGYHYRIGETLAHNSSAQYGVLGVWALKRGRGEVHTGYWRACWDYWSKGQNTDGGWGYHVRHVKPAKSRLSTQAAMVPAGVASLFICFDNIHADKFIACEGGELPAEIRRGLAWFDKNFMRSLTDKKFTIGHANMYGYYLYGVERVGLAAGYKYFGKVNWYKEGAKFLLRRQSKSGYWVNDRTGGVVPTSFALLFLVRGRHPVVFNKLEFHGDWNNRPRDMAFLTRWMTNKFERSLNWQIVNLNVDVGEWNDAPILYLSGAKAPEFSDAHLAKLRDYVQQGGTIFSATECDGKAFSDGIREVYRKLFPTYELTLVGPDHDLYTEKTHFDVTSEAKFEVISNGIRPLVVHTDVDLPKIWQLQNTASGRWAFESATNLFVYVTAKGKLPHRGTNHWPAAVSTKDMPVVKIARLKHNGNDNPEPQALQRFARLMAARCKVNVQPVGPIPIAGLAESAPAVAILSGTNEFSLNNDETAALKAFVAGGGTLLIEAAGGVTYKTDSATNMPKIAGFAASAEALIETMYESVPLRRVSTNSPVYALKGKELRKVVYRGQARKRLGGDTTPNLRAVLIDDRPAIFYTREDITHGLLGTPSLPVDGYDSESAFAILRNIVLTSMPKP